MIIDRVVNYCDEMYTKYKRTCGCGKCNHPSGECSGNCYNCLYEIHYPSRAKEPAKKLYDCQKMLYHYVCQYSYLYATELLYAFEEEFDYIKDYPYYHIMSLGCGGCADIMAFEKFKNEQGLTQSISYMGFDVNELWYPINEYTKKCCEEKDIKISINYSDVFKCFNGRVISNTNIVIISYLISYLYNTNQIKTIDRFIDIFTQNIIKKKGDGKKLLLIINDVNSCYRGRDYFKDFTDKIEQKNLSIITKKYKYFDPGNLNIKQKIGTPYSNFECRFNVPYEIKNKYHTDVSCKQTIQLIVEVI